MDSTSLDQIYKAFFSGAEMALANPAGTKPEQYTRLCMLAEILHRNGLDARLSPHGNTAITLMAQLSDKASGFAQIVRMVDGDCHNDAPTRTAETAGATHGRIATDGKVRG